MSGGEPVADSAIHVVVDGNGIKVDKHIDGALASEVISLILGGPAEAVKGSQRRSPTRKRPAKSGKGPKGKARKRRSSPKIVKDLSLKPKGKPSFADFVSEKQPTTHKERQVTSLYWLLKVAEVEGPIGIDHVNTCYVAAKWKRPADFENSLSATAARNGWLETSDTEDLGITVAGEDLVNHDLPRKGSD